MKEDVFEQLYRQYHLYVYRYLMGLTGQHHTAEDLTQETFVRAFSVLQNPRDPIKAWLLTVAHNLYVDHVKKWGRIDVRDKDSFPEHHTAGVEADVLERDRTKKLFRRIQELPDGQKQALLLCSINGLSHLETATILGVSVSAVTNLVYRARKTLKDGRDFDE